MTTKTSKPPGGSMWMMTYPSGLIEIWTILSDRIWLKDKESVHFSNSKGEDHEEIYLDDWEYSIDQGWLKRIR